MTQEHSGSALRNEDETLDEYAARNQAEITRLVTLAHRDGKLHESEYSRFVTDVFEGDSWDEAFGFFERQYKEIEAALIRDRILKGADIIDKEPDPLMRRKYMRVYDELLEKLQQLQAS